MPGSTIVGANHKWVYLSVICLLVVLGISKYTMEGFWIATPPVSNDYVDQMPSSELRNRDVLYTTTAANVLGGDETTLMSSSPLNKVSEILKKCSGSAPPHADVPVLYNLNTQLGVTYGGDHWFHVAENFMAAHSALRANDGHTDATDIYFNFDKPGFSLELNSITRLMVAIAAIRGSRSHKHSHSQDQVGLGLNRPPAPKQKDMTLHFLHIPADVLAPGEKESLLPGQLLQLPSMQNLRDHQLVRLSASVPADLRFKPEEMSASAITSYDRACVAYKGSYGGAWPTPQRGHWFEKPGDTEDFRRKLSQLCPKDEKFLQKKKPEASTNRKLRKMVIYQRDLSRKLADEQEALELLAKDFPASDWEISVLLHTPDASPCYLAHLLHDCDVLLTPHGFQSMLLLFLPQPALVFEIFPYRYYKRGYGPLALDYGLHHAGVMSPPLTWHRKFFLGLVTTEWCMLSKQCRNYARGDNVKLTAHGVSSLATAVREVLDPALLKRKKAGRGSLYD